MNKIIIASTIGLYVVALAGGCMPARRREFEEEAVQVEYQLERNFNEDDFQSGVIAASTMAEAVNIVNKLEKKDNEGKSNKEESKEIEREIIEETNTAEINTTEQIKETEKIDIPTETTQVVTTALIESDTPKKEDKVASFVDKRIAFWFTESSHYVGNYSGPNINFYADYEMQVSDYYTWLYQVNGTYFRYYGELLNAPTETGVYIFNSGEARDKNIWGENQMKQLANSLTYQGITETEAVNNIINYFKNNFSYRHTGYEDGLMYNLLSTYNGNCESFSRLFKEICNYIGIDCQYIEGYANGDHAWNRVYVNNQWYYVDITWYKADREDCRMSEGLWNDHSIQLIID